MDIYYDKTDLIIDLQTRGYDHDFMIYKEGLLCIQSNDIIAPDDFEIMASYHFKRSTERAEDYIIYAVNLIHCDMKGILMTTFSSYNRGVSIHLWSKLSASIQNAMEEWRNSRFVELALN